MRKVYFMLFLLCLTIVSISAVEYAEMYNVDSTTDLIVTTWTAENWRQVEGFTGGLFSTNWDTSTDNQLTKNYTDVDNNGNGKYIVRYSVSFKGSVGDWVLGISVDGATPIHAVTRRIGDTDDVGNASGSGIITLDAESSQNIQLYVKNPASAEVFIVKHAQVVMTQLKQAELGTFGEMYYSAGTTHQIKPSGQAIDTSFTKLTDFNSSGNLNNVTYSSNALTVGSSGNYLVCLTMSFWGDGNSIYTAGLLLTVAIPQKLS